METQHPIPFETVPEGFTKLEPLEMNAVTFNARRTVITPQLIDQMAEDNTKSTNK